MRISLLQTFVNGDDTPAVDAATKKPINLRWALTQICLNEVDGDGQPVKGEAKVRRYDLYRKIKKAGDVIELSAEDITVLKAGALAFPTLMAGQTRDMLETAYADPTPPPAEPAA